MRSTESRSAATPPVAVRRSTGPRRLFWRYLTTPRALYLPFDRSRLSVTDRTLD
jgi:hypothetical protein